MSDGNSEEEKNRRFANGENERRQRKAMKLGRSEVLGPMPMGLH